MRTILTANKSSIVAPNSWIRKARTIIFFVPPGKEARPSGPRSWGGNSYLPRPWEGVCFDICEELHGFGDAFLDGIARVLDAAEGGGLDPVAGLFPDVAGTHVQPVDEGNRAVQVIGADAGAEAELRAVRDAHHRVVVIRHPHDRHDGAKGFPPSPARCHAAPCQPRSAAAARPGGAGLVKDFGAVRLGHVDALFEQLCRLRMGSRSPVRFPGSADRRT